MQFHLLNSSSNKSWGIYALCNTQVINPFVGNLPDSDAVAPVNTRQCERPFRQERPVVFEGGRDKGPGLNQFIDCLTASTIRNGS